MWYWNSESFEGLKSVYDNLKGNPKYLNYANYCKFKEQGLRKQAFNFLNEFISSAVNWDLKERYCFVEILMNILNSNPHIHGLIPQPLDTKLVQLTLHEWIKENESDPSGYRWLGGEDNWRKALTLDPQDKISEKRLIKRIIYNVYFSTHHMPDGYIGDAKEDMKEISEVEALILNLDNDEEKIKYINELQGYKPWVICYLKYLESGFTGYFRDWYKLNNN